MAKHWFYVVSYSLAFTAFDPGANILDKVVSTLSSVGVGALAVSRHSSPVALESLSYASIEIDDILDRLDLYRLQVVKQLDPARRSSLGQFLTPGSVARLMASMLTLEGKNEVNLLDPGAGIGALFAASIDALCRRQNRPTRIMVTAYEIEPVFLEYLDQTVQRCRDLCERFGVEFHAQVFNTDFIASAASILERDLSSSPLPNYTHAILNPPYHKIRSDSIVRKTLRTCGVETGNLYTAFLSLASMLLGKDGQIVSITPRSFCNGPYFRPFREQFLSAMQIERVHLFDSRQEAFRTDDILQENIVMSARKSTSTLQKVMVSSSFGPGDEIRAKEVDRFDIVSPDDQDLVIHVPTAQLQTQITTLDRRLSSSLESLGLEVSTGRVVDFRSRAFINQDMPVGAAPLIYPTHFHRGYVRWPAKMSRKPNSIVVAHQTCDLLLPSENYVLVKRFSSKEERRRIMAVVYDSSRSDARYVAFENHLNYFHKDNHGLDLAVAKGLAAFLNSTFVDTFFRRFSGHTQVNAADLRKLPYPDLGKLETLGRAIGREFPDQEELDLLIEREL